MDDLIKAIAEPNRRKVLRLLADREMSSGEIAAQFEVSPPAISQHLAVLMKANLLVQRREGTFRYYSLRREAFSDLRAFLDSFWKDSLEQLKEAAEWEEMENAVERSHN